MALLHVKYLWLSFRLKSESSTLFTLIMEIGPNLNRRVQPGIANYAAAAARQPVISPGYTEYMS